MKPRNDTPAELSVGQFGRLAQLSRKALRLYDERGLLPPARVDARNGYRYYLRAQVAVARRIKLLRLMEMPLEDVARVLAALEDDPAAARRLIQAHIENMKERYEVARTAMRLLGSDLSFEKESIMSFEYLQVEYPARMVVSIRKRIRAPAYHEWIHPALESLWGHIEASGARTAGEPLALYYGPVNESDDGPVEICVPYEGTVPPKGEITVRELPAHRAVQVRTYGEYNEYPKLLEMWDGLAQHVHTSQFEGDWTAGLTTYEIWHEDMTMTICWPVKRTSAEPAV